MTGAIGADLGAGLTYLASLGQDPPLPDWLTASPLGLGWGPGQIGDRRARRGREGARARGRAVRRARGAKGHKWRYAPRAPDASSWLGTGVPLEQARRRELTAFVR